MDELRREVEEVYEATKNKVGSENMGTPEYEEYLARFSHIQESESLTIYLPLAVLRASPTGSFCGRSEPQDDILRGNPGHHR